MYGIYLRIPDWIWEAEILKFDVGNVSVVNDGPADLQNILGMSFLEIKIFT